MSLYDDTTALPNRRLLESRLDEAVRNHQLGGDRLAVLVIDIDEFTKLNDALGHRVGDALLQQVAGRLVETVRTSDLVARVCMAKVVATQAMQFCADAAVQTLGGMGYMRGTKSERIYREVKVMMIGGGAEEIMKELAARQLGL